MARQFLTILVLALLPVGALAQVVTEMTPDLIKQALADQKTDTCYGFGPSAGFGAIKLSGAPGYGCFTTPYSRVVAAARDATKKYKSFTEADVTPEMIVPEAHFHAFAQRRDHGPGMVDVEAVVLMPKGSKDRAAAIQPIRADQMTAEYKNLMGATFEGKSITAVFPLTVLDERNEVRVVFGSPICGGSLKRSADCAAKLKLDKVR